MSVSICSRCLARLQLSNARSTAPSTILSSSGSSSSSSYHTSAPRQAAPANQPYKAKIMYRVTSTPSYTGKRRGRTIPKLPAPGERRAARKRIVLSNTNALEIKGLEDLSTDNMTDETRIGNMLALEGGLLDRLRDAEVFQKSQNWPLFRRPATLMRKETVEMGKLIEKISGDKQTVVRQIITGEKMCGKSILLLQAMSMAYMNGWVVVNVPKAIEHVNNHHSYAPLSSQDQNGPDRRYLQPSLTVDLLQRLIYSNEAVLKDMKAHNPPPSTIFTTSKPPTDLISVATYGIDHPTQSWPVFLYLMNELTAPSRPPVLLAIDGLDHWMGPSSYRSSDHTILHAHQFTLVQYFLKSLFSNTSSFPNGGLILAATTASNNPVYPSFTSLLSQLVALQNSVPASSPLFPLPSPYATLDPRVSNLLSAAAQAQTQVQILKGLSRNETHGLLTYLVKSGILKDTLDEDSVGAKWAMSGSGNVGMLCELGKRQRVDPEKVLSGFGTNVGIRRGQGEHLPKGSRR